MKGAFRGAVGLEFVRETIEHRGAEREEAAMILECGVRDEAALVAKRRNAVAEDFGRFRGNDGAHDGANFLESGARGLRNAGKILVNGFRFVYPHYRFLSYWIGAVTGIFESTRFLESLDPAFSPSAWSSTEPWIFLARIAASIKSLVSRLIESIMSDR